MAGPPSSSWPFSGLSSLAPVLHALPAAGHAAGEVLHAVLMAVEMASLTVAAVAITFAAVPAARAVRRHHAVRQLERASAQRARAEAIQRRERAMITAIL